MHFLSALLVWFSFSPLGFSGGLSEAERLIRQACEEKQVSVSSKGFESLPRLLQELQDDFREESARLANPQGYLRAMNEAIAASPFSWALKCGEALNREKPGSYSVAFIDPKKLDQTMSVRTSLEKKAAVSTLEFSLAGSVQIVFFTYIHELTHVCQARDRVKLKRAERRAFAALAGNEAEYRKYSGISYPAKLGASLARRFREYDQAASEHMRSSYLGELEAFKMMLGAFTVFTQMSPRLCREENEARSDMSGAYLSLLRRLEEGVFAQDIVSSYLDNYPTKPEFLFQVDAPKSEYRLGSEVVSLHPFTKEFRAQIEALGIKVEEP